MQWNLLRIVRVNTVTQLHQHTAVCVTRRVWYCTLLLWADFGKFCEFFRLFAIQVWFFKVKFCAEFSSPLLPHLQYLFITYPNALGGMLQLCRICWRRSRLSSGRVCRAAAPISEPSASLLRTVWNDSKSYRTRGFWLNNSPAKVDPDLNLVTKTTSFGGFVSGKVKAGSTDLGNL